MPQDQRSHEDEVEVLPEVSDAAQGEYRRLIDRLKKQAEEEKKAKQDKPDEV